MRSALAALTLLLLLVPIAGAEDHEGEARRPDLVIAHTNDLHARYRSFESRSGELRGGFARLGARIGELREEHGDRFLYLDAGDLFMGTPFYHFYRGSLGIELMELMGCDAQVLGNHELDDGSLNYLRAAVGADYPRLCLNLHRADGSALLPAAALIEVGDLSLEIVGVITEAMPELSGECARGELLVTPPVIALERWLAKPRPDADLRLVLSHCGLEEDRGIAESLPELPLIIGGHSHNFLEAPELVNDVTICQVGCYGYFLGVLECYRQPDGSWDFRHRREAVTADWPEDPAVKALIEGAADFVDREMNTVLTELPESFDGRSKSRLPDPLGIMIADLMRRAAGADLGMQNIGGYRSYLPAGDISRERVFELLPFNNRVLRLHFSGADLAQLFDRLALNHDGGRFAQIAGGSYGIDGEDASALQVGGNALDPDATYTLATLDFLYGDGDGYGDILHLASRVDTLTAFGRDLLEARLLENPAPLPGDYPPNFSVVE
jgi:5'-nucleotidase / UDP-sugar diphosphatase